MAVGFACDLRSSVGAFSFVFPPSKGSSDCFQDGVRRNVWGAMKIKLLDTSFWGILSDSPEKYGDRFQKKLNLLDYNFVVMPMFKL
jgi:hypothetical protein